MSDIVYKNQAFFNATQRRIKPSDMSVLLPPYMCLMAAPLEVLNSFLQKFFNSVGYLLNIEKIRVTGVSLKKSPNP